MDMYIVTNTINDLVESSEQSASKMSDLVTSIFEIKSLAGWRLSLSNGVKKLHVVNVELKYNMFGKMK